MIRFCLQLNFCDHFVFTHFPCLKIKKRMIPLIPGYDYSPEFRTNFEHTAYAFVEYKGSYTKSNTISENDLNAKETKLEDKDKEK